MPAAKLKASDASEVMKTEEKVDTIIRQAIGNEPFLCFPRASDSPAQWIRFLHALDQQELPGWPLLSPIKVQLQKCDKCSQEFCSTINYRRHIRVHHRMKKLEKDSKKTRDLLGAYWDKLSAEEAKEVVSFSDVMLEDVRGSSILDSLTTLVEKQAFLLLPQYYLRAGASLLDITHSDSSSFPISSHELFRILDDASEKTCLWGSAVSMQRYVFDGEAGKIGLQPKNLVACTSFLLEQKLVKAWLADKDTEALRCQKQLVEEEEAAQRRQAEILERKRQKKLRQKEQKARERRHINEEEIIGNIDSTVKALSPAEASLDTYNFEARNPDAVEDNTPSHVPFQCPDTTDERDGDNQSGYDLGTDQNVERRSAHGHNYQRKAVARRHGVPKSQLTVASGLQTNQVSPGSKLEVTQKYVTHHDQRAAAMVNSGKVWSQKHTPEINRVVSKTITEKEPDLVKSHEVLIGSIPLNLGKCSKSEGNMVASQERCVVEGVVKQNRKQDKPMKPDSVASGNNRVTSKLWRPVSRLETIDPFPVQSDGTEVDAVYGSGDCQNLSGSNCLRLSSIDGGDVDFGNNFSHLEDKVEPGSLWVACHSVKVFLAQRWKESFTLDHDLLGISPGSEPPGCQEILDSKTAACKSSDVDRSNILGNAENELAASSRVTKSKLRKRSGKGTKIKYIPSGKQIPNMKKEIRLFSHTDLHSLTCQLNLLAQVPDLSVAQLKVGFTGKSFYILPFSFKR